MISFRYFCRVWWSLAILLNILITDDDTRECLGATTARLDQNRGQKQGVVEIIMLCKSRQCDQSWQSINLPSWNAVLEESWKLEIYSLVQMRCSFLNNLIRFRFDTAACVKFRFNELCGWLVDWMDTSVLGFSVSELERFFIHSSIFVCVLFSFPIFDCTIEQHSWIRCFFGGIMTLLGFFGCALAAFGPAVSFFAIVIARDPIRVIILIAS